MKTIVTTGIKSLMASAILWSLPTTLPAFTPSANDLNLAIKTGDFGRYLATVTEWLNAKAPGQADEASLTALLKDPVFANTLDQRQLISKIGADKLGAFARSSPANAAFLSWLMASTEAMDQYLEACVPVHLAAREQNSYTISTAPLELWSKILQADPEAKTGIPLRLAIATAIRPPGTGAPGAGQQKTPSDPIVRYKYFKTAHANKELFPSFNNLTAWDMQYVVSSGASEDDLTWGRQMINTWRPDLRINELVVNSTSEVWRRNSPIDFAGTFKNVLTGGGKCGPRSSWSVFICQAFGVPAIGVGQPAHACVAYKTVNPMTEPQPGYAWKVGYGRGWHVSKLEGMGGTDFLAGAQEREHRAEFSKVERLRWLASALPAARQPAVMEIAHKVQQSAKDAKTDLTASAKADEAEKELIPGKAAPATAGSSAPVKLTSGTTIIDAAQFSGMQAVRVLNSFPSGKQVNFDKSLPTSWIEYTVEVPVSGTYSVELTTATPNDAQFFDLTVGSSAPLNIQIPNTKGLWGKTPKVEVRLEQGTQKLKFAAPSQRGVAVRQLEIKAKG